MAAEILVKFLGDAKPLEAAAAHAESKLKGVSTAGIAGVAGVAAAAVGIGGALIGVGRQFETAYDGLRVKTGETGAALKGLEDSTKNVFKGTPASLATVTEAIGTLHQKLGLTGKPLEELSGQMISLSRITKTDLKENMDALTGSFQNWNVKAEDQKGMMNEFFRASQASGVSVAELATKTTESGVVLRQFGFDIHQSAALTATMAKAGVDIGEVMPAMGKALATAGKHGYDAGQMFKDTFEKIKGAGSETEAAGEAIDVFGAKAGPKLAAMIREGKLSYEDMLKTMTSGGDTIAAAGKDTAHFSGAWTKLTHEVLVAVEPIATKMFLALDNGLKMIIPPAKEAIHFISAFADQLIHSDGFKNALEQIAGFFRSAFEEIKLIISTVVSWIREHWSTIKDVFFISFEVIKTAIKDAVVAFKSIYDVLKSVFDFITSHKELMIGLAVAVGTVLVAALVSWAVSAAAAAAASIAAGVAAAAAWIAAAAPAVALVAAIAAVVAAVLYAYNHFQWFHELVDAIGRFIRDVIWPILLRLGDILITIVAAYIKIVIEYIKLWWEALQTLWQVAKVVFDSIKDAVTGFIDLFSGIGRKLASAGAGMWDWIKDTFKSAINGLIDLWNGFHIPSKHFDIGIPGVPSFDTPDIRLPQLPRLAKGGLATSAMLAVIGDTIGDSEIVSPTKMMRQIVREESGGGSSVNIGTVNLGLQSTPADLVRELSWYAKQTRH